MLSFASSSSCFKCSRLSAPLSSARVLDVIGSASCNELFAAHSSDGGLSSRSRLTAPADPSVPGPDSAGAKRFLKRFDPLGEAKPISSKQIRQSCICRFIGGLNKMWRSNRTHRRRSTAAKSWSSTIDSPVTELMCSKTHMMRTWKFSIGELPSVLRVANPCFQKHNSRGKVSPPGWRQALVGSGTQRMTFLSLLINLFLERRYMH